MRIQSVSDIEKALENLDAKKTAIEARAVEIAEQQKRLGFVAMIGRDKSATASLAQLNTEASAIDGALEGLSAAIAGGQQRLALARAAEANLADQQEARELAEALEVFTACGNEIDAALETLATAPQRMQRALQRMHDLGAPRPDHRQFSTLSKEAIISALRRTVWASEFPPQPVSQRRRFGDLVTSWSAAIHSRIASRLGATEKAA